MYSSDLYPLLKGFSTLNWVITVRDKEFINEAVDVCSDLSTKFSSTVIGLQTLYIYDVFNGYYNNTRESQTLNSSIKNPNQTLPIEAFLAFINNKENNDSLFFKDAHNIRDAKFWRAIINSIPKLIEYQKKIFLLSPQNLIYSDYNRQIYIYNHRLPDEEQRKKMITDKVTFYKKLYKEKGKNLVVCNINDLVKISAGLILSEIEIGLRKSISECHEINQDVFNQYRCEIIRNNSRINFLDEKISFDDIGGLENLKNYTKKIFSKNNLPRSGIILIGIPGTAKTMFANALSNHLKIPGILFDISSIFNKSIGESEKSMRASLDTIETIGECVLILDEIDKIIGGVESSNKTDGGVTNRVFEILLNWLNKKNRKCYIIATSNDLDQLPPEFIRAGRWDCIFMVDIPNKLELREIFKKKSMEFGIPNWEKHFDALNNEKKLEQITGAEIRQLIINYCYSADDNNDNGNWDEAIKYVPRIAIQQSEKLKKIRDKGKFYVKASIDIDDMPFFVSEDGQIIK